MAKPSISIHYCPGCRWLPRACWMAQELLETFSDDLDSVALHPAETGTFRVLVEGEVAWDRRVDNGFPQPKEIKQRVRDLIEPGRDLGHIDH